MNSVPNFKERFETAYAAWGDFTYELAVALESEDDVGQADWLSMASQLAESYYPLLQLMVDAGFAGVDDFRRLCDGGTLSLGDMVSEYYEGKVKRETLFPEVMGRLDRMSNIAQAFRSAKDVVAASEAGATPKEVLSEYKKALGDLKASGNLSTGPRLRFVLERAVTLACIEANVVVTPSEGVGKRARFCDKVKTLVANRELKQADADVLIPLQKVLNETAHPGRQPEFADVVLRADNGLRVLSRLLNPRRA